MEEFLYRLAVKFNNLMSWLTQNAWWVLGGLGLIVVVAGFVIAWRSGCYTKAVADLPGYCLLFLQN